MSEGGTVRTDHTGRLVEVIPPTPERLAKGDITTFETERGGREDRACNDALGYYLAQGVITLKQEMAGQRFYDLWRATDLSFRFAQVKYDLVAIGGTPDPLAGDRVEELFRKASAAIRDQTTRTAVIRVCCYSEWANALHRRHGYSRRGAMRSLHAGLDDLVKHFGY